jgi:hypothetical protein
LKLAGAEFPGPYLSFYSKNPFTEILHEAPYSHVGGARVIVIISGSVENNKKRPMEEDRMGRVPER